MRERVRGTVGEFQKQKQTLSSLSFFFLVARLFVESTFSQVPPMRSYNQIKERWMFGLKNSYITFLANYPIHFCQ